MLSESKKRHKHASETSAFLKTHVLGGESTSLEFKCMFSVFAVWTGVYVEKTRYYHDCFGFICSLTNYQCFSDQTEEFLVAGVSYSVVLCSPVV